MITNEHLAELITQIDRNTFGWVYNRHCKFCGRYLYDETKCKKCHTPTNNPILRPIPFLSSATAIEKLILWLRNSKRTEILNAVLAIISDWAKSDQDTDTYKMRILIQVDLMLKRG